MNAKPFTWTEEETHGWARAGSDALLLSNSYQDGVRVRVVVIDRVGKRDIVLRGDTAALPEQRFNVQKPRSASGGTSPFLHYVETAQRPGSLSGRPKYTLHSTQDPEAVLALRAQIVAGALARVKHAVEDLSVWQPRGAKRSRADITAAGRNLERLVAEYQDAAVAELNYQEWNAARQADADAAAVRA